MTGPLQFSGAGVAPPGAAAPPLDLQNTNGALSNLLPSLLGVQHGGAAPNLSQAAQAGTNQLAGPLQSLSGDTPTLGAPALSGGGRLLAGEELASRGPARSGRAGRTTSDHQPANSYNARHQQAEARRRSRINERLEALRQLVPHTERANTANFLEEVVAYVQRLQRRVVQLEQQQGLPPSVQLPARAITFSDDTTQQTLQTAQREDRRALQTQSQVGLPPPMPLPQQQEPQDAAAAQAALTALLAQHQQQQAAQQAQLQLQLLLQQTMAQQAQQAAQQQQQQSADSRPLLHTTDSAGDRQQSIGLQMLAAADSGGAVSAGEANRRSGSTPLRDGGAGSAAGMAPPRPSLKLGGEADGIPTDEEVDMLHQELLGQDSKRRRLVGL
ncbi:hypothetical protein ABPG75_005788 [Micractinium tetrahymenae]